MSKFQTVLAEVAYAIAGHGFAENEIGSVSEPGEGPWQATVRVTRMGLMNLGEDDLMESFVEAVGEDHADDEFYVWITEDEQGFVNEEAMCNASLMPDQIAVMDRDWLAVEAHYESPLCSVHGYVNCSICSRG